MSLWQIKDKSTEQVLYRYESDENLQGQGKFGWQWDDPDQQFVIHEEVPQETLTQEAQDEKWAGLRRIRESKLRAEVDVAKKYMDWAEVTDSPWTQEKKNEWLDYRQALLDVPNDVSDIDALDLASYVWPTKPEL